MASESLLVIGYLNGSPVSASAGYQVLELKSTLI